jgi:Uma2 family endonuclease
MMMGMAIRTALTPEDLLTLPPPGEDQYYELSGGELIVVSKARARHEKIKSRLLSVFFVYATQHPGTGEVYAESMFPLGPDTARIPDVAFVVQAKAKLIPDADVVIPVVPDLAVEIISASESAADAERKVQEYLAAGVLEVWQLYPNQRLVRVRTTDGVRDVSHDQVLETPLLPGLQIVVSSLFTG